MPYPAENVGWAKTRRLLCTLRNGPQLCGRSDDVNQVCGNILFHRVLDKHIQQLISLIKVEL